MTEFGKRPNPPAQAAPAGVAMSMASHTPAQAEAPPAGARRRPPLPLWLHLVLLAVLGPILALQLFEGAPTVRDGAPGRQFMAPGFAVPSGCPARRWSEGEYMPRACAEGPGRLPGASAYGLPYVATGSRHYRRRLKWVRTGPDAALVQCVLLNCRVWAVAAYRFRSPPGGIDGVYDPEVRDYRRKPLDYLLVESAAVLAMPLLAILLALGWILIPRRSATATG